MKTAVLVSCFDYYPNRMELIESYLAENGYNVIYITSNYDPVIRGEFVSSNPAAIQIPVIQYKKSISIDRVRSHYGFAKGVYQKLLELKPDLIVAMLPPNFVSYFVAKYKRKFPQTKLVLDIYDLWPQSFPSEKAKKVLALPFYFWSLLRNSSLKNADLILTECHYYQDILRDVLPKNVPTSTFYLARKKNQENKTAVLNSQEIRFCYLGSINNVIDIDGIVSLLDAVNHQKPVTIEIIGGGQRTEEFMEKLKEKNIEIVFHGKIFDDAEKQEIFNRCHYGINMMKDTVAVGLTMKSLDYFNGNLPIVNTIKGDTKQLVEDYQVGVNVYLNNLDQSVKDILEMADINEPLMRSQVESVFNQYFSVDAVNQTVRKALEDSLIINRKLEI